MDGRKKKRNLSAIQWILLTSWIFTPCLWTSETLNKNWTKWRQRVWTRKTNANLSHSINFVFMPILSPLPKDRCKNSCPFLAYRLTCRSSFIGCWHFFCISQMTASREQSSFAIWSIRCSLFCVMLSSTSSILVIRKSSCSSRNWCSSSKSVFTVSLFLSSCSYNKPKKRQTICPKGKNTLINSNKSHHL